MTTRDGAYTTDRGDLRERASRTLSGLPRPIVRWAGSKQRLLTQLIDVIPDRFGTYYEPFLGSGALFFLLGPANARISDTCAQLVDTYRSVAASPAEVHDLLQRFDPFDKEMYYRVRSASPQSPTEAAARFLYLNRTCWNGLYRVNKRGEFNVPYGAPKSPSLPDLPLLEAAAGVLTQPGVNIDVCDFEETVKDASDGDFAFFDPPYVTGHNNNGFVDYNEKLFSWADQERLAATARRLADRGVRVVITNADHDAVRDLYGGFVISSTTRFSTLANNKTFRRPITEALIHSPL